ncbi:hypothetical protein REPUB_Repub04eG0184700 [Reevesia pubescens]
MVCFFCPVIPLDFSYETRYLILTFCLHSYWTTECTAADAFKHAGENIVFASGSPFENVILGNEKVGHVNQANNMYLFPGLVLFTLFIAVFLTILRS